MPPHKRFYSHCWSWRFSFWKSLLTFTELHTFFFLFFSSLLFQASALSFAHTHTDTHAHTETYCIYNHMQNLKRKLNFTCCASQKSHTFLTNRASLCGFSVMRESEQNVFFILHHVKETSMLYAKPYRLSVRSSPCTVPTTLYTLAEVCFLRILKHLKTCYLWCQELTAIMSWLTVMWPSVTWGCSVCPSVSFTSTQWVCVCECVCEGKVLCNF